MSAVVTSLIPVFLLIVLGYGLRKGGIIAPPLWKGVEELSYWVLFPALLFRVVYRADLEFAAVLPFVAALLATLGLAAAALWLARRRVMARLAMSGATYSSLIQTTLRWNGFLSLAVADKLMGAEGLALIAIAFATIIVPINIISVLGIAVLAGREPPRPGRLLWRVLTNPFVFTILLAFAARALTPALPDVLMTALDLLGRGALGIALLVVGAGLQYRALKSAGSGIALAIALRLVAMPALALGLGWLFGLAEPMRVALALTFGVPTAVNGYVLARQMGGDAEYYAAAATGQVIASALTLPLFLWLAFSS